MKQCYRPGCYFDMPRQCPCSPCHCPQFPPQGCCQPMPCENSCGCINIAIPIGLLIFAGGFLLGQKC